MATVPRSPFLDQGRRIRIGLLERGITLAQVARDCGVSRGTVSHVLRGRRRSLAVEAHIAQVLGVSKMHLFGPNLKKPHGTRWRNYQKGHHRAAV